MPAPAQGALAIEAVKDSTAARAIETLIDEQASAASLGERTVLSRLEAGCTAPVAATSTIENGQLTVRGGVFALDGSRQLLASATGPLSDAAQLGSAVSEELFSRGAAELLGN